eukprot:scaffold13742_cov40-Tisochrysis_lutea.AAC.5
MRENHLEADFARPGHHVAACLVSVPGLHRMPTWAKTREAMFEMCEDHPMEQCDDCTEVREQGCHAVPLCTIMLLANHVADNSAADD